MTNDRQKEQTTRGGLVLALLVAIALLGLLAGCSSGAETPPPGQSTRSTPTPSSTWQTITITAIDYGYVMPNSFTLRAGLVDLELVNNGTQPHQAQLVRLNPGVTDEQVVNELIDQRQEARAFSLFTYVGGPDTISPDDGQAALLDVPAGNYALICLVTGADGLPHVDKGMIRFLTVSPAHTSQPLPQVNGVIAIQDHQYVLPSALTQAHVSTFKVENQGTEPHELNIVRLASGKSAQDVLTFFRAPSGPPPFEEFGGMATLASGLSGWITIHLQPGNYAVLSAVPDPKTGAFQLTQGLLTTFSVQ
jgi:outer membrane protein assembly factor BamE (lipoprotein component of BamABCDE complex)